jgi:dihydropyrimidinase
MGLEDFRKIPNGTAGVEDRMSVLWHHGVRTGKLTPSEFVAVTSTNTARIFNMYPKKGSLEVGADADVVIWDPNSTRTISKDTHHQNIDFNIFEGMEVTGGAAVTMSRGSVVWERGELKAVEGAGRYVNRPPFPYYWDSVKLRNQLAEPTKVERATPKAP